jgi:hypothetical protein
MNAVGSISKKQSDASLASDKPPNPVFFLDRCLGRHVVANALRGIGESVELHCDHFSQDAADPVWVPDVGRRGWIILTKDRHIKTNQIEIISLLRANTWCFNLMSASISGPEMAASFVAAIHDMKQLIDRMQPPVVATVNKIGNVAVLLTYGDLVKKID